MPEIAVVIPAYIPNARQVDWLIRAIDSVRAQTFADLEIVVVNDDSPIVVSESTRLGIRWINHDRRRGPGAARNTGVAATSAPWIIALDADDMLYADALEKLYQARCEYGVVYGDIEWIGERQGIHRTEEWSAQRLFKINGLLPVTALHSRKAWRAVGGWNEDLTALEDCEYWMRLAARGVCGQRINAVTLQYRKHSDSRQSVLEQKKQSHAEVSNRIRRLHASQYNRLNIMAKSCSKCPGSAGPGNGVRFMTEGIQSGVELKYMGPLAGSFTLRGRTSGLSYRIGGKGSYVTVDASDVDQFLGMNAGGISNFITAPVSAAPDTAAAALPLQDTPNPDLPAITALKVNDALPEIAAATDVLDLRVWLAEERASEHPRSTIVKAIEARVAELQPADA